MAFQNIASANSLQTANIPLGLLVQIAFSNGIRNQISTDYRDYEMIKRAKVGNSLARELRFLFQTSLGPSAIQYANPGVAARSFPGAQNVSTSEYIAVLKEMDATLELDYAVFDRVRKNPEKYGEPLQLEVQSKLASAKRRMAADLYGDGTGVLGQVGSVSGSIAAKGDSCVVTLKSGGYGQIGLCELNDYLVVKEADGTAASAASDAVFEIVDKDRDTGKIKLKLVSETDTAGTPAADEVFYRVGQNVFPNLAAVSDYGTASEVMAGLGSLVANDGRVIHGITMSGVTAGSHFDAQGNPLDVKHIRKLMSKVKIAVGQDRYSWKMLTMAPETHNTLMESVETDRTFQTVDDTKRGGKVFAYIHGNDTLECVESEFCPQDKIYVLPETKGGEKVLEFHGSDFETVKGQDMSDWHLKVDGGYRNSMVSYLNSKGVLICKHPSSVGVLKGFTNS